MQRVGRDGLLYGGHVPGDDNFHNPLTNIDFRVTPPVRRASITLTPQPEIQFESYFEAPKSSEPSGFTTPTQPVMRSSQLGEGDGQIPRDTRLPGTETGEVNENPVSVTGASLGGTATSQQPTQRQPKHFSELFAEKEQHPSTTSSPPSATDSTSAHEEAFGTNLTTGRREYLSQYPHIPQTQGAIGNVNDKRKSLASPIAQDDTVSTDSSLSADSTDISDSDTGAESLTFEDTDVY